MTQVCKQRSIAQKIDTTGLTDQDEIVRVTLIDLIGTL